MAEHSVGYWADSKAGRMVDRSAAMMADSMADRKAAPKVASMAECWAAH